MKDRPTAMPSTVASRPGPTDDEHSTGPPPEPAVAKRSLARRLFALMLVAGALGIVVLSGVRWWSRREAARQRDIARHIEALGGETRMWRNRVVQATFAASPFGRESVELLCELPDLRRLVLIDVSLERSSLARLRAIPKLSELVVIHADLVDTDMACVAACSGLEYLQLNATHISDAGLCQLKPLRALQRLDIIQAEISDEGLSCLKELTALSRVRLQGTRVTKEGVQALQLALPMTDIELQ